MIPGMGKLFNDFSTVGNIFRDFLIQEIIVFWFVAFMSQSRKRMTLSSQDQSTESPSSVSNGEKAEKLSNVISHWKQENAVSMAHKLSTREQLVHSTPWMKQFVLEIMRYRRFCEEIVGS